MNIERVTPAGIDFVIKQGSPNATILIMNPVALLHTKGKFVPGHSTEQWRFEGSNCIDLPRDKDWEEIFNHIPPFTVISLVGSQRLLEQRRRLAKEQQQRKEEEQEKKKKTANNNKKDDNDIDDENNEEGEISWSADDADTIELPNRPSLDDSRSHMIEIMQQTRQELDNGQISMNELQECIRPLRLQPDRVECMLGGPDSTVMWNRWEWSRLKQQQRGSVHTTTTTTTTTKDPLIWSNPRQLVPH